MIRPICKSVLSCLYRTVAIIGIVLFFIATELNSQDFASVTQLSAFTTTKNTGEKPQSKVWKHDGKWWSVFPNSSGTYIWRLDGNSWNNVFKIATNSIVKADCKVVNNVCHIFLWKKADSPSKLVSVEYVPSSKNYRLWSERSSTAFIQLDSGVETATIDIDATGRMWLASDGVDDIRARWSDPPYAKWSAPIIIASGVKNDDIAAVISLPAQGQIGIFWSNQNSKRFGFKTHTNGTAPSAWSADELPASQSALDIGMGMSDDHLNIARASDGTLYCAIKTGYDEPGYPLVALLKRQPNGTWDDLYEVSQAGTRPITVLNEAAGKLKVIFTLHEGGGDIVYRESRFPDISFGPVNTLIRGIYDNPTSSKDNYDPDIVVLASDRTQVVGAIGHDDPAQTTTPAAPKPVAPANLSVDVVTNPTFSWEAAADADSYHLQVALSSGFSSLVYNEFNIIETSTESGTVLNHDTRYYWRVRAANAGGYSDWSIPWSFTTSALPTGEGLAGYWEFDEGSGTTIIDESGYGNNGQIKGGALWEAGVSGSGLKVNGSNQYAFVEDSPSLDLSEGITLAAWIRPEKTSAQYIISKGNPGTDGYKLSLLSTGKVSLRINENTSTIYKINSRKLYPVDGNWMHIAGTFNGTLLKIFINGIEDKEIAFDSPTSIMTNSLPLVIGASANETNFFQGIIDDVRIYNYALSDSEIQDLVAGPAAKNTETARVAQPKSIQQVTNVENREHPSENKIGIYPNPAQNTLFIDLLPGSGNTISISDMYGRVFYRTITTGEESTLTINLDDLSMKSGLYLLLRQSPDSMTIAKFVKK